MKATICLLTKVALAVIGFQQYVCAEDQYPKQQVALLQSFEPEHAPHTPMRGGPFSAKDKTYNGYNISYGNFLIFETREDWDGPSPHDRDDALAKQTFQVYTVAAIDTYVANLTKAEEDVRKDMKGVEQNIRTEVVKALNEIPTKLLTTEAQAQIKAEVLSEMKSEISQLREELMTELAKLREATPPKTSNP
jgi:hypothetical protein